jgi:glycosyltransferase involved in cell wall biosynthesis
MSNSDITVLILTYNEEKHIARCIESVNKFASDIVIIDSYSTDNTVKIAAELGARVLQNPWTNHATQFNWGLDNADITTEWIFRIDADEYFESGEKEIRKLSEISEDITGIYLRRKYFFMSSWIRHGTMYPILHLRIWRTKAGRVENRWMDERTVLKYGNAVNLAIDIVDDNKNNLGWWIEKHNSYSTCEVVDNLNSKYQFMPSDSSILQSGGKQAIARRMLKENFYNKLPLFVRPTFYYLYRYFFRLGFLDGTRGFIFHFLQGFWYRMLVDFKLYEIEKHLDGETNPEQVKKLISEFTKLNL